MKKVVIIFLVFIACKNKQSNKEASISNQPTKPITYTTYSLPLGFSFTDTEKQTKNKIDSLLKNGKIGKKQQYNLDGVSINAYPYKLYYKNENFVETAFRFDYSDKMLTRLLLFGNITPNINEEDVLQFFISKYGTAKTVDYGKEWLTDSTVYIEYKNYNGSFYIGYVSKAVIKKEEQQQQGNIEAQKEKEIQKAEKYKKDF